VKFGVSGVNLSTNVEHYSEVVDAVAKAEEVGFESAWFSDRTRDTYVNMTACALATRRIRVAAGIANPFTRHPAVTARAIASLDEVSGGRAILGIGAGNMVEMTRDMGFDTRRTYLRIKEAVVIMKKLLRGETVTLAGEFYSLSNVKLGFKGRSDVPIFIAGQGPKILETAGEVADGAVVPYNDDKILAKVFQSISRGAGRVGRKAGDLDLVVWLPVYLTEGGSSFLETLRGYAALMVLLSPQKWLEDVGVTEEIYEKIKRGYAKGAHVDPKLEAEYAIRAKEYITDRIVDTFLLVGSQADVVERIARLEKMGFKRFVVWTPSPVQSVKLRFLDDFATKIMTRLK